MRSNIKLSQQQIEQLRAQAALSQHRADFLTGAISLSQQDRLPYRPQRLLSLHRERLFCRNDTRACLEVISPICWVPLELLIEIFVYCLPQDHRFSPTTAPLLFCQVCSSWRNIVTSSPCFWTKLALWSSPPPLTPPLYLATYVRIPYYPIDTANRWLAHSQQLPLELFLERFMDPGHLGMFVEGILLRHLGRCCHLELNVAASIQFSTQCVYFGDFLTYIWE